MVFWDVTPCGWLCRYQDYGVLGCVTPRLICRYEDYGVLGFYTTWFFR
jgi:hypothetical protein